MRVYLQQPACGQEPARYLQLTLVSDLFGGWELLRETGEVGGRVQLRRELYLLQEEAQRAFDKARDSQLKRGYQLMTAPGKPDAGV
jgi:predicted DNA-binding WGR domain protein